MASFDTLKYLGGSAGWRKTWSSIIPGHFGGNSHTDLLFYDAAQGGGEFYTTDGHGGVQRLEGGTGWRKTWSSIIPGNFGGNDYTDLLFYDATKGEVEFYTTDGRGGAKMLGRHTGWRKTWSSIIPGHFGGDSHTDLLLYDATKGEVEFYTTDGRGGAKMLGRHTGWRKTWSSIIPGNFGGNGYTDLLLYDATKGEVEFYTTDGRGGAKMLGRHTGWRKTWSSIIPGNFGGDGHTDLFLYDAAKGECELYTTDGRGGVQRLDGSAGWRKTWSSIIPGNFGGDGHTDLLFYDATEGKGEFYDLRLSSNERQRKVRVELLDVFCKETEDIGFFGAGSEDELTILWGAIIGTTGVSGEWSTDIDNGDRISIKPRSKSVLFDGELSEESRFELIVSLTDRDSGKNWKKMREKIEEYVRKGTALAKQAAATQSSGDSGSFLASSSSDGGLESLIAEAISEIGGLDGDDFLGEDQIYTTVGQLPLGEKDHHLRFTQDGADYTVRVRTNVQG